MSELEQAAAALGEAPDTAKRRRFFAALLSSNLLVELAGPPESEGRMSLVALQAADGRKALGAFSGEAALRAWKPECEYMAAIPGLGFFKMAYDRGLELVVLDPGGVSWEMSGSDLEALARGMIPELKAGSGRSARVEVSAPLEEISQEALSWLAAALGRRPEVTAAYFFTAAFGENPPILCLGVCANLPLEGTPALIAQLERELAGVPPIGKDGFTLGPVVPEMLEGVLRFGRPVFKR